MSTPPCIIGAVIMKITSSSNMTSMRLTTLISAFSASRSRRRRGTSDVALAHEQRDHRRSERLEQALDAIEPAGEDVVGEGRRNRDRERGGRRDERFAHAQRERPQVALA